MSNPPVVSRLSQNSARPITAPITEDFANGLWRCNEEGGTTIHVGIYARNGGIALVLEETKSIMMSQN